MQAEPVGAVLVVGGGIAGMQAALDLAEEGFRVHLVTREPSLGGRMARLDKTFPTNDCAMCLLGPRMGAVERHPDIQVHTLSELVALEGEAGNFTARVREEARRVDVEACTNCGSCWEKCPARLDNAFDLGQGKRKAVGLFFPQAVPAAPHIVGERCLYVQKGTCRLCEEVCGPGALRLEAKGRETVLEVGAVILAPGSEAFDADRRGEYGHGVYRNVLTAPELERLLSPSGPTTGEVRRPSDGRVPRRVAFISCVGSRDAARGRAYCSAVCCMYTAKEARLLLEHHPATECTVFYQDLRAVGKGFDAYVEGVRRMGARYVRSLPSALAEDPATRNLSVRYRDDAGFNREEFDLVVLAVGLEPPARAGELARAARIELDARGFCRTDPVWPGRTTREGVLAAGAFLGPRDIPDTVASASAAASQVARALAPARGRLSVTRVYPPERADQGPARIGVAVCRCGTNIASVVDVPRVAGFAEGLPGVAWAGEVTYACSQGSLAELAAVVERESLNRLVVASCSIRTHLPLFREAMREAGLNPFLVEMANIRDQCSWVHRDEPEAATEKSEDLVAMAVYKAARLTPLATGKVPVVKTVLVVGAGPAGLAAAVELGGQGFEVELVEREEHLGGNLRRLSRTAEGVDAAALLAQLEAQVAAEPGIRVHTLTQLVAVGGSPGRFHSTLERQGARWEVAHGAVVLAPGTRELDQVGHGHGSDPRVLTALELDQRLRREDFAAGEGKTTVLLACVGSRQDDRPYCSRTCCIQGVRQARELARRDPTGRVYLLYRDLRSYGFWEEEYLAAREEGVVFLRFDPAAPPRVEPGETLTVRVRDEIAELELELAADRLVLLAAAVPAPGMAQLTGLFRAPLNAEGFLLETHAKLAPLESPAAGVFLAGSGLYPRTAGEAMVQGRGAAARAAALLARGELPAGGAVATVDPERCAGCLTCVRVCPYGIPRMNALGKAEIDPAVCHGCGTCVGDCPADAIELGFYDNRELRGKLAGLTVRRRSA